MEIIVHTMRNCPRCEGCRKFFKRCNIKAKWVLDVPPRDFEYPYIATKIGIKVKLYSYEEIVDAISRGVI